MNKLFTKIVGAALGLTMAIGVGVAVANNSEAVPVHAADTLSYTITSKYNGSDSDASGEVTANKTNMFSTGTDEISSVSRSKVFLGKSSAQALKFGSSSAKGTMTITLAPAGQVKATKVVFSIAAANDTSKKVNLSLNDATSGTGYRKITYGSSAANFSDYEVAWDGSTNLTSIKVEAQNASSNRFYLKYIKVYVNDGKTLSSISVTSDTHRTFAQGDEFVKETITAHYSDSSTADVTTSATFSGYNMSTTGNQTVTVSYIEGGTTKTATYTITVNDPRTVTSLEVLDDETNELSDGDEVSLTATGESVSTDITCGVTYTSGSPDGAVTITSSPSTNFALTTEDDETYTLTFTANGDYNVTIAAAADDNYSITVTYSVNGITASIYKKVASAGSLKSGSQIIIGKSDGNYVLEKYVSGNNCPAGSITPTDADTIPASALTSSTAILTLSGSAGSWTLTDQDDQIYYGTKDQNRLQASSTATDTWTIQISDGVATMYSKATGSGRCLRKNSSSNLFACYTSAQHGISIYMLPSNNPEIDVDVASGSTSLSVNGTATLTATLKNTTGTVTWSLVDNTPTGTGNVAQISADGNSVTVTGKKDGTVKVRAAFTGCDNVDTLFTVTKALSSIAVTTAPSTTTYTEGQTFSTTGMVVTATYDDGSTSTPNDYTYSPTGALTPSDTTITISYGGKSTTQAITVNAKVVSSIAVQSGPTKNSYHADDEFVSAGLTIRVTYEGGSTADITSGFTISPDSYTFTSADETAGSKTFTVTYSGKTTTFSVTVAGITGPIASGRYYIMNSAKTHGLNAVAATNASPTALSLSTANELTAFDVVLMADNEYEISVTISETKYLLVCNTTATSSSNTSIRITSSPSANLKTNYWNLDNNGVETDGAYYVSENTTGSTNRYLSCYSDSGTPKDWRGYAGASGDREIQFVPEGSYADAIADSLLNDITCDDGAHAPSTSVWSDISDAYSDITIAHEKALLTGGTADEESEDTIEQALARYDYIVGKYNKGQGITAYNDFLSRNPSPVGNSKIILNAVFNGNSNTVAIIVIISMVSVTAIGGYFFLRKRKEI